MMKAFRSDFLQTLSERGFINQGTDLEGLDALMSKQSIAAYIGFDATADSLHVGSLVQIMMLLHLQRTGHKAIALMGGGTSKVGDPSFKDTQRQLLSDEDIDRNLQGIQKIFAKFLTFGDGPKDALMLNNARWLDNINYLAFLRDYGKHFSINRMLSFESVKLRLEREQPLSFLEFNYMILQAYDFLVLSRSHGCRLQLGGSDQWGNIINGIELTRRIDQQELFGVTSHLITTASGHKMGKTAAGAVWLNEERLAAYDYWQFWRNTHDADVERFLGLFTLLPMEEVRRLGKLQGAELNQAKIILADEATAFIHGRHILETIHTTTSHLFSTGGAGDMSALPHVIITAPDLADGIPLLTLLQQAGLSSSNGEGRRLIRSNAIRWDDKILTDETMRISRQDFGDKETIILSAGKKKHAAIICS